MVAARDGTNRAPFPQVSKDPELQMWEEIGSPGWARTSDFLINSPTRSLYTEAHDDLSSRYLDRAPVAYVSARAGGSRWVGTTVEPAPTWSRAPKLLAEDEAAVLQRDGHREVPDVEVLARDRSGYCTGAGRRAHDRRVAQ